VRGGAQARWPREGDRGRVASAGDHDGDDGAAMEAHAS